MAAATEDEFDLYGGEDDVYPQPDAAVSGIHPLVLLVPTFTFCCVTVRDSEGPSCPHYIHDHGPRSRSR